MIGRMNGHSIPAPLQELFGITFVISFNLVPSPPAKISTFIRSTSYIFLLKIFKTTLIIFLISAFLYLGEIGILIVSEPIFFALG